MIEQTHGNLLEADVEALVNTVNCVGVMGKGLALQFRQAYPENFREYAKACRAGTVRLGHMLTVPTETLLGPRYIINFPTKCHWKDNSHLQDIESGLTDLIAEVRRLEIGSIAVPPLGCGNGGLDWTDVRPLIERAFAAVPEVQVLLYAPEGAPAVDTMRVGAEKKPLTTTRALFIKLLDLYQISGYRLSLLETQKLAYFLQEAGEPLKLNYVKHKFGPYADNLNHVLQRLEGHYIRGYGDRTRRAEIQVLPGAVEAAQAVIAVSPESNLRLERISRLIEGFDTPYGMELLATVHWAAHENGFAGNNLQALIEAVHAWNARKRERFKAIHIRIAWGRLLDEGWI